jgi:hypothetical protein
MISDVMNVAKQADLSPSLKLPEMKGVQKTMF